MTDEKGTIMIALRSLLIILLIVSSGHSMARETLKKRWHSGLDNMCEYTDGSVVNMGYKSCLSSIQNGSANRQSEAMIKEQLRLGQQSTDMMSQGINQITGGKGLIPMMLDSVMGGNKERKLQKVLDEYPNSKATLQSSAFRKWVAENDVRERYFMAAYNGDAKRLDDLLAIYSMDTLPETDPDFRKWLDETYGLEKVIRLVLKADKSGDYSPIKRFIKGFFARNTQNASQRSLDGGGYWKRIYCKDQSIPPIITAHEANHCPVGSSPH